MITGPAEIFNTLWSARGSSFTPQSREEIDFVYEALSMDMGFTGAYRVEIPKISDGACSDWALFEYWLEEIQPNISMDDLKLDEDLWADDAPTPSELLGTRGQIEQRVISALREMEKDDTGIAYVEVQADDRTLFLLYEGLDGWGLGHGGTIEIVESLEELTEEKWVFQL